jgi:hypothetical protein
MLGQGRFYVGGTLSFPRIVVTAPQSLVRFKEMYPLHAQPFAAAIPELPDV